MESNNKTASTASERPLYKFVTMFPFDPTLRLGRDSVSNFHIDLLLMFKRRNPLNEAQWSDAKYVEEENRHEGDSILPAHH